MGGTLSFRRLNSRRSKVVFKSFLKTRFSRGSITTLICKPTVAMEVVSAVVSVERTTHAEYSGNKVGQPT